MNGEFPQESGGPPGERREVPEEPAGGPIEPPDRLPEELPGGSGEEKRNGGREEGRNGGGNGDGQNGDGQNGDEQNGDEQNGDEQNGEDEAQKRKLRVFVNCACYDFPDDITPGEKKTLTGRDPDTGEEIEIEVTWQSSSQEGARENFKNALKDNYDVVIVSTHANFGSAFDIESGCREHSADLPIDEGFRDLARGGDDDDVVEGAPKALVILSCSSAVPYGPPGQKPHPPVTERIKRYMPDTNVVGSNNAMPFCEQADVKSILEALRTGTKPGELNRDDHVKPHETTE